MLNKKRWTLWWIDAAGRNSVATRAEIRRVCLRAYIT